MWLYIWLAVTAAALIVEFLTSDMVSIWFAGGGLIAMILAAFELDWYIHLPVFIVVSAALMLCFRSAVIRRLRGKEEKTNAEAVFGKEYKLLSAIEFNQPGSIRVNDVVWSAVTENPEQKLAEGTLVKIKDLKGNKYIVEEIK